MHTRYNHSFLLTVHDGRMTAYADKMANDKFDGTKGFSIDGGIKDARYFFPLRPHQDLAERNTSPATSGGSLQNSTLLCLSSISPTNTCSPQGLDTSQTRYREQRSMRPSIGVPWFLVSGLLRA